jgi:hypothetical protein
MGNRVRIIASQTHTRLPNGWRFCPISIPIGTIFVSYPYPNRGISHGLSSIGSPLTSLGQANGQAKNKQTDFKGNDSLCLPSPGFPFSAHRSRPEMLPASALRRVQCCEATLFLWDGWCMQKLYSLKTVPVLCLYLCGPTK